MEYTNPAYHVLRIQSEAPPEIPYGIQMVGAPLEWVETKGAGIKVAVIDTGSPNHPDIKVTNAISFVGGSPLDERGHGTHVSSTIAANGKIKGVAPEVELYVLKVAKTSGGLDSAAIAKALYWCRDNGMDVVNMSLGGPAPDSGIAAACKACYDAGIVLVASAGNYGRDYGVLYPAKLPEVIATAAVDVNKQVADFSAYGMELDVAAAGVEVWGCWLNNQYCFLQGTSMASPHIAGAAALIQAKGKIREGKKYSPGEVLKFLRLYAEDLGEKGNDERYGCGVFSFGRISETKVLKMKIGNKVYMVNGQEHGMDVAPKLIEGRSWTPSRYVAEGLGATVEWNGANQEVIATLRTG